MLTLYHLHHQQSKAGKKKNARNCDSSLAVRFKYLLKRFGSFANCNQHVILLCCKVPEL